MGFPSKKRCLWVVAGMMAVLGSLALILRFGGHILVFSDPLPEHAEVAIVLTGSAVAQEARRKEAFRLLNQGVVDQVMLSVGKVYYYGQWLPDLVRSYIQSKYGKEVSARVTLCAMLADSTAAETGALLSCVKEHRWRSVIVVTSNYHTRRARLIWRLAEKNSPPTRVSFHGVLDGTFEARDWWRRRRYAKTWLLETTKLIWTYAVGL